MQQQSRQHARFLINKDQPADAVKLARLAVAGFQRLYGSKHSDTLKAMTTLSMALVGCGDRAEAELQARSGGAIAARIGAEALEDTAIMRQLLDSVAS